VQQPLHCDRPDTQFVLHRRRRGRVSLHVFLLNCSSAAFHRRLQPAQAHVWQPWPRVLYLSQMRLPRALGFLWVWAASLGQPDSVTLSTFPVDKCRQQQPATCTGCTVSVRAA
jgi:hypothetical protein